MKATLIPMSPDEYFDDHIPHRINLMIAFRERYSGRSPQITLNPEKYRDLFRCAKDMSFLMVRFFCEEMGIKLPRHGNEVKEVKDWKPRFNVLRLRKKDLEAESIKYSDLCEVLKAANRAVAHIEDHAVNHAFKTAVDDKRIFGVVDWIMELIDKNIYRANGRDLPRALSLPNNLMCDTTHLN